MAGIARVERLWSWLLEAMPEKYLMTVGTFVLHELFYWVSFVPFLVLDMMPACRQWKIQDDKSNDRGSMWHCMRLVLLNHFSLVLPIVLATHLFPVFKLTVGLPLPAVSVMVGQIFFCFLVEDFVFYWVHRALHTPFLYRHIHSVHHRFAAPFGIAAEYAHPLEVILLGFATCAGPIILHPHLLTLWLYLLLRCFQTVECHSGYDFPWSINRWLPLYGGADFHDHHHRTYSGNFASVFVWMDRIHGTDTTYRDWKQRQQPRSSPKGKAL